MGELNKKQIQFTYMIGQLIDYAYKNGYGLTFGDAYRDPRAPYGSEISLHHDRLAVDFNLFIDGAYITDPKLYEPLGRFWVSIGGEWGGYPEDREDANHFSLGYQGKW